MGWIRIESTSREDENRRVQVMGVYDACQDIEERITRRTGGERRRGVETSHLAHHHNASSKILGSLLLGLLHGHHLSVLRGHKLAALQATGGQQLRANGSGCFPFPELPPPNPFFFFLREGTAQREKDVA